MGIALSSALRRGGNILTKSGRQPDPPSSSIHGASAELHPEPQTEEVDPYLALELVKPAKQTHTVDRSRTEEEGNVSDARITRRRLGPISLEVLSGNVVERALVKLEPNDTLQKHPSAA